ncbi:MAG: response regulator [Desulfohalobiaceae bacterium]|nr:response regulator [Desulfohalobiaceae bacterium]
MAGHPNADAANELLNILKQLQAQLAKADLEQLFAQDHQQDSRPDIRAAARSAALVLEGSPEPVLIADRDGSFVYVNGAFTRIFGWGPEEIHTSPSLFLPEEQLPLFRLRMQEAATATTQLRFETQVLTKDSRLLDTLLGIGCIQGSDSSVLGLLLHFTEVSSYKTVEKQLRQSQKMEALSNMAAGIAHEFNNILMGIQGRTSLTLMEQTLSDSAHEHLKEVEEYIYRASGLTQMLLSFSRGEKLDFQPTDLNELVTNSVDMFGRARQEIIIHQTEQPDIWTVDVDRDHIEQILMNLFVNAWQAMPNGGELFVQTENTTFEDPSPLFSELVPGRYVKVSVRDTGFGMDEETLERVFEPFFTTHENIGAGLGLSSVYGIVKNHQGHITITSSPDKGTTVEIYFPARDAARETRLAAEAQGLEETQTGTETILIVDNEQMIIDVSQKLLETLGYTVLTALGGRSALEIYEREKEAIDLVILDIIMPDLSGDEVYPRLKFMNPEVKVLISSGYSISGVATKLLNQGCNGFIQKPFNLKLLSHKVREVLDSREAG